ncbi:MAG: hypothetical protein K6G30_11505 [Acetatifactor sp.]|nr:hypothetical protein [Acetatifactor sp.]
MEMDSFRNYEGHSGIFTRKKRDYFKGKERNKAVFVEVQDRRSDLCCDYAT